MAYTTADCVYDKVGVTSAQIGTDQMTRILAAADAEVDRIIKTTCVPKLRNDLFTGNDKNLHFVRFIPLLALKKVEINDTAIDMTDIISEYTGRIELLNGADQQYFYSSVDKPNCKLQYYWGWLEETSTQTTTTAATTAGDDTEFTLTTFAENDYAEGDWVEVSGFDGYKEAVLLTAVDQGTKKITGNTVCPHEADSIVTKLGVPPIVSQLACVIGAIMGATYMMGSTYTFATSYSVPDYSVTKGVPYPHFNRNMEVWVKERDFIISQLPPWPTFA